ncbi:MAG TPA: Crp/Fnr family transcriptional regulator [Candidatus Galloscillospira stercoripullorum]|nr:Crp/Fnr family transcriptional regulator [Candidatus Galloscillospira stercoripullorum]
MSERSEFPHSLIPDEILAQARELRREPGEYITRAATPVEHFYVMGAGLAKLIYDAPDGEPLILDLYRQGDFFGEMEMVGVGYNDRSIVAMTECTLYEFSREAFFRLWSACPEFSLYVLRLHCQRLLRSGTDKIYAERLVLKEKVMHLIRLHGNELGYFPYTKDVLSEMAGVSIRSLNRTLAALKESGLIRISKGTIRLLT